MPFADIALRDNGTGTFDVALSSATSTLEPVGIVSEETFGTPQIAIDVTLEVNGTASEEAFGTHQMVYNVTVTAVSIDSAEIVPTGIDVVSDTVITVSEITTAEAFGTPQIVYDVSLSPNGLDTGETFGTPTVASANDIDSLALLRRRLRKSSSIDAINKQSPYVLQVEAYFWVPGSADVWGRDRRLINEEVDRCITVNVQLQEAVAIFPPRPEQITQSHLQVTARIISIQERIREHVSCNLINVTFPGACEVENLREGESAVKVNVKSLGGKTLSSVDATVKASSISCSLNDVVVSVSVRK